MHNPCMTRFCPAALACLMITAVTAASGCDSKSERNERTYNKVSFAKCIASKVGLPRQHDQGRGVPARVQRAAAQGEGLLVVEFPGRAGGAGVRLTLAFLAAPSAALALPDGADERHGNVLIYFDRAPTPAQRETISDCLDAAVPSNRDRFS